MPVLAADGPLWTDVLSALATLGAAIGTVGAVVVALRQSRTATKRSLVVRCQHAVLPDLPKSDVISLSATNNGFRPVKITMGYFMLDDGWQLVQIPGMFSTQLPATLQDGESVNLFFDRDGLEHLSSERNAQIAYGFLTDTASGVYKAWYPGYKPPVPRSLLRRIARSREPYLPPRSGNPAGDVGGRESG
jgi:hypothetical protein